MITQRSDIQDGDSKVKLNHKKLTQGKTKS